MGILGNSYEPLTGAEWVEKGKSFLNRIAATLGIPTPRYDLSEFSTQTLLLAAQMAAEIDDAVAGIIDNFSIFNASGSLLADLAYLAGVVPSPGTKSSVTLRLTAWPTGDVLVSKGKRYGDGTHTWATDVDVVVPAGSTADVLAICDVAGPIAAAIASVKVRIDVVTGITAVTNPAIASIGSYVETDASIRSRIFSGMYGIGSFSPLAIRAAIENLPDVERCRLVFNDTESAIVSSGVTIPKFGLGVWVYPKGLSATAERRVMGALFALLPATIPLALPTTADVTAGTGMRGYVVGADERDHTLGAWYMLPRKIRVRVDIHPATGLSPGYTVAGLADAIRSAVGVYLGTLDPGQDVEHDVLIGAVAQVQGVIRSEVYFALETSSGSGTYGSYTTADPQLDPAQYAVLDSCTPTEV
jgi:hypothetical protein